jgi:hypothetical protein
MRTVRVGLLARQRNERGAVASIVVILLTFGLVIGMTALTMDVGSLMWERRQLQNGADAAANSLADTCANDAAECSAANTTTLAGLSSLNDGNASDTKNGFEKGTYGDGLCGRNAGSLPPCNLPDGSLTDCGPLPDNLTAHTDVPYVEVHTKTRTASGSVLPPWLAQAMFGSSYSGEAVGACSRAAYGTPGSYSLQAPVTLSMCEWQKATANGTLYQASPVYNGGSSPDNGYGGASQPPWPTAATTPPTPPNVGNEIKIYLQTTTVPSSCPNFNGHDSPGGFGYLASGCPSNVTTPSWQNISTGNNYPCGSPNMSSFYGKVVYLPVFTCMVKSGSQPTAAPDASTVCNGGAGSNTYDYVPGLAKFYLSGYKVSGSDEMPSLVSGSVPCGGNDRCLSGWFLDGVLHNAVPSGPPDNQNNFGPIAVQPAG